MQQSQKNSEVTIFKGKPSQAVNLKTFSICGLIFILAMLGPGVINKMAQSSLFFYENKDVLFTILKIIFFIPILYAGVTWLKTHNHNYLISNERLKEQVGILSKVTNELELFRVKDITIEEPLFLRIFNCANIILDTSDKTTPIIVLTSIKNSEDLVNKLRNNVEIMRAKKGVREID